MKKQKRNFILIIIFVLIMEVTINFVYAENETNAVVNSVTNTNSVTSTNSINSTANTTTTTNSSNGTSTNLTTQKSSNANLSNLGIRPNDFKGFKASVTSYEVEVPLSVSQVEIYATAQDKNAKITGIGTKKLNEGLNECSIVVTAEDGTTKTYTLDITRTEEVADIENTETATIENSGLSKLEITNAKQITPEFSSNVYEYTVKFIGDGTKLDINAEPTESSYIVEISGNEDLQEGENIVTILVSDKDDKNVATYQLIVNKSLIDEEEVAREKAEREQMILNIALGIVILMIVIVIVMLIVRKRKNNYANEYNEPYKRTNYDKKEKSARGKIEKGKRYK